MREESKKLLNLPNAGGSSQKSESLALEVCMNYLNSRGVQSEMEIKYFNEWWKKCDFITWFPCNLFSLNNQKKVNKFYSTGVSVTRAVFTNNYNPDDLDLMVSKLISKKLSGLVVARAGIREEWMFTRSMLFVWSPSHLITKLIIQTFKYGTDKSINRNVSLIIAEIFSNSISQKEIDFMLANDFFSEIKEFDENDIPKKFEKVYFKLYMVNFNNI